MCDQQRLKPSCAYAPSDQSLCLSLAYSMIVNLLTEHHWEFLRIKCGCKGLSESTLVKIQHCWKSHVMAQMVLRLSKRDICSQAKKRKCLASGYPTDPNILEPTQTFLKTFRIFKSIFRLFLRIFILFPCKKVFIKKKFAYLSTLKTGHVTGNKAYFSFGPTINGLLCRGFF